MMGMQSYSLTSLLLTYGLPIALVAAWQFKPFRRAIIFVLSLIPAWFLFVLGIFAFVLWKPVNWLGDKLSRFLPINRFSQFLLDRAANTGTDALREGDREGYSEQVWPKETYPELYQAVPEDIERPLYEDGRLPGGRGIVWLADRYMTDAAYTSAFRGGLKASLVVLTVILLYLVLNIFFDVAGFIPALLEGERPIIEQWPGDEPVRVSTWSLLSANFGAALTDLSKNLATVLMSALALIPLAIGVGLIVTVLLLSSWMRAKSEPYRLVTKDADVRWAFRSEIRELVRQTFRRQLEQATGYLKDSPVFPVGRATGMLRARGDLSAPTPGQPLNLDRESLFQHTLVFGGTGEGKTTALLKPLMRQVLADRKFGAFVADAKGVLWQDVQGVADSIDRQDDVVVIGSGAGQKGLNPIASLNPTQIAAALRSVLRQVSGNASDSFWPDMAANVLRHALTIGQAYAQTKAGQNEFEASGINPYSLWWAYRAVTITGNEDHPGPLDYAVSSLRREYDSEADDWESAIDRNDSDEADRIKSRLDTIYSPDVMSSIEYLTGAWVSMAPQTKTGIVASITQLLDGFSGAKSLRERFAEGRTENTVDINAALDGKLVLIALSSIEDGLPARLTSILIKTALYREARVREIAWKRDGKSPQDQPCLVVMDEVQELATVDPASGLSDASFWNVARSTGLAGVFATQTIAALVQAMGDKAAGNFIQQARTKIFFRTEERDTVEYACWCAGEYERNRVYEDGHRESIEFRYLIDGWDPFVPVDETEVIEARPKSFFDAAIGLINPKRLSVDRAKRQATYEADERFIGPATDRQHRSERQAAEWRAEDLTRQYRMHGNEKHRALSQADLIHMGRWHAFAQVQRAGAVRQDIITVEHDFS